MSRESDNCVVKCPFCKKQRLFDIAYKSKGIITIKCQRCGEIVKINLENVQHTVLSK